MNRSERFQTFRAHWRDLWRRQAHVASLILATSAVWLLFGLVFKVFDIVPRHRMIVARLLGESASGPLTILIGLGECGIALWILSGVRPRACAAFQTAAILIMNSLELSLARDLLLAPAPMVCANLAFLAAVWYGALKISLMRRTP